MRKILLIICAILTTTSVHATQMCARRDTTVIPLDSIIQGKPNYYWNDPHERIWYSEFEYGRIYGAGTCLSIQDIRDIEDDQTLSTTKNPLATDEETYQGRSGYYNDDTTNPEYERKHCYCKLTHPMSSCWSFHYTYIDAPTCGPNCAGSCASYANTTIDWRTKIFNHIGISYIDINTKEYDESINLN